MTSVSTIGQSTFLNSQLLNIESQLNDLTNQVSSGKKSATFSGINSVSQLSLQLNSSLTVTNGYLTNISNAQTLIAPIQNVLQQITDIANQLRTDSLVASSDALPVTQGNATLQAEATDALNQISSLLNTRVGNTYLFGGRNTTTPPMPNFGSAANASSIAGQVAALQGANPLTTATPSGDQLYNAIQNFLNNGLTRTTSTGATVPSPFGYTGETGEPGGSDFRFSTAAGAAAGATSITVSQGFDLPTVGQYIEFGTLPPTNAAYQVTAVNQATRTITFARATSPAVTALGPSTGLHAAIPAHPAVNVTSPSWVTTVSANGANSADTTFPGVTAAFGARVSSVTVPKAGDYSVGETFKFANDAANTYQVTGLNTSTNTITFQTTPGALPLQNPVRSGTQITPLTGPFSGTAGSTQMVVQTPANYKVGDRISLSTDPANTFYDVTAVNGDAITISQVPGGGGLVNPITTATAITVNHSYQAGTNVVNVGSTTGVTAGMSGKFSNSNINYNLASIVSPTQIQVVPLGQSQGSGLETTMPPSEPIPGQQITASFGTAIQPLSVQIDNGVSLQYGIPADTHAIRTVLGAIFALATTNLNTTTQGGFREVAARAAADLQTGSREVSTVASTLGVKQQTLDATKTRLSDFTTTLQTQLSSLNDVDMASAVSQLTETQTQLEASFKLISSLKTMSLANYP